MKTKALYACELCKTDYAVQKDAETCEASHIKPKGLTKKMKFHAFRSGSDPILHTGGGGNYPDWIDIEMQDGETVRYKK